MIESQKHEDCSAIRFNANSLVGPAKPLKEVLRTGLAAVVLLSAAPSSSEVLEPLAGGIRIYDVVKKKEADSTVARPVAIVTDEQQRQLDSDVKAIIEKYSKPVTFGEFDDFKNKVYQKLDGLYIFNTFMILENAYSANEDRRLRREELEKKKNKNNWFWHSDE